MYTNTFNLVSEHVIPNEGFRMIHTPLQDSKENNQLLVERIGKTYVYDLANRQETLVDDEKALHIIDLTNRYFAKLTVNNTDLVLTLFHKNSSATQSLQVGGIQKQQINHIRFAAKEDVRKSNSVTCYFSLFILQRYETLQNNSNPQHVFIIHQFGATLTGNEAKLQFTKKVELSATLRSFDLIPLGDDRCLLYGPQHSTSKPFQFIVWDNKDVVVHQTEAALKGTVVTVLPCQYNLEEISIFHNTNGGHSPNVLIYNLVTKYEKNIQILEANDNPALLVQVLPNIVQYSYYYLVTNNLSRNELLIYDLTVNQIVLRVPGGNGTVSLLDRHTLVHVSSSFDKNEVRIGILHQHSPMVVSLHYLLSLVKLDDCLVEELYQQIDAGQVPEFK